MHFQSHWAFLSGGGVLLSIVGEPSRTAQSRLTWETTKWADADRLSNYFIAGS
jgi:hypothetical protein